jgi:2'-5' RNA ligase
MGDAETRPDVLRTFVGVKIDPTPGLRDVLRSLEEMGKAVRPVREDQLHVTLKFLADTNADIVPRLAEDLTRELAGTGAFDWNLRGTGAFPSPARPSVVWAGGDDNQRFRSLAERVERAAAVHGFAREARAFHPHVTLARIKFRPPFALGELLRETASQEFGRQRAAEVVLYRSELGRGGSVYMPLHVVTL